MDLPPLPALLALSLDLALLLGFTLRLSRLVVTDDVGWWWFRLPARRWANRRELPDPTPDAVQSAYGIRGVDLTYPDRLLAEPRPVNGWRSKLVSGLSCPFCVGFWLAALALASLLVAWWVGGFLLAAWRVVAGLFTLNWVAAHIGASLGDVNYDDSEES